MKRLKIAILASGNGSNAENILKLAAEHPEWLDVRAVITDNPGAYVIERSQKFKAECLVIPFEKKATIEEGKNAHESRILGVLRERGVEWVCLAGYQRILSHKFIEEFYDLNLIASRVINIHPSLLPSFRGKDAYTQAYDFGVKLSGVTLHFVDSGVDTGPIFLQGHFERFENDTPEQFVARGLEVEYRLYRRGLELLAREKVRGVRTQNRTYISIQGE